MQVKVGRSSNLGGDHSEDAQAAPSPSSTSPRPRVGDPAMAALNAAAFQMLATSGTQTYRLHQGRMMWQQRPPMLDGIKSQDLSYYADRVGHGQLSRELVAPRTPRAPLSPPPPADPIFPRVQTSSPRSRNAKDGALPCSRAEAIATADKLRRGLEGLDAEAALAEEIALWDEAFGEVVSQAGRRAARPRLAPRTPLGPSPPHAPPPGPTLRRPRRLGWGRCTCTARSAGSCSSRSSSTTARPSAGLWTRGRRSSSGSASGRRRRSRRPRAWLPRARQRVPSVRSSPVSSLGAPSLAAVRLAGPSEGPARSLHGRPSGWEGLAAAAGARLRPLARGGRSP